MEKFRNISGKLEAGYTLVEHILTLSILAIIILLATPLSFQRIDNMTHKQFLKLFSSDLLYTQNLAMHYPTDDVRMQLNKNDYEILIGFHNRVVIQRQLPEGWKINNDEIKKVSFNKFGTVLKPGTITINAGNKIYDIILPFGKGRERIVEK